MRHRVIVVGSGAWGLPAALELQDRGHEVTLIERFHAGNPYASSGGTTRLWRLLDTQLWRAEAMVTAIERMEALSDRLGAEIFRRTGVLWRDDESLDVAAGILDRLGSSYSWLAPDEVDQAFPGLRPAGRGAVFSAEAGVIHTDVLFTASLRAFTVAGGIYLPYTRVLQVNPGTETSTVTLGDGMVLEADHVVIAAGPGTRELLPGLGLELPIKPYIEQVVYVGDPHAAIPAPDLPVFIDCPTDTDDGIYAMPNREHGYKLGLDLPLRNLDHGILGDDLDREASDKRTELLRKRVARDLTSIVPHVLATQVCSITDSGDGNFIVGNTHPTVTLACGDSGEGFKFSPFMGQHLANLVEGVDRDNPLHELWEPQRFTFTEPRRGFDPIGRH